MGEKLIEEIKKAILKDEKFLLELKKAIKQAEIEYNRNYEENYKSRYD